MLTILLLDDLGGTLMISLVILPSLTAWRCWHMAPICQFQTKGVPGSIICQAALT